ncbi:MAG: DUF4412 domain-containing protein [Flavobacteriales bacterium]|nr:DUF4412 domain-containing protein [Flavobacteriales bacterium]
MKKIILCFSALCISLLSFAQFEGEVKYSISISGDKEIEQQKAMMPTHYRMLFRNGDSKFIQEGGMMASIMGDVITKAKEGKTYFVNHSMKMVNEFTPKESENKSEIKPIVTKENETVKILGYQCQKYKVVTKNDKGEDVVTTYLWVSKDIKVTTKGGSKKYGAGQFQYEDVEGFPLKIQVVTKAQGSNLTMTMTAVNLSTTPPDEKEFEIPASYTKEEGLPGLLKMAEMMGGSK